MGIGMPIPTEEKDACKLGLVKCPIRKGEVNTFTYKGNLDDDVPSVSKA